MDFEWIKCTKKALIFHQLGLSWISPLEKVKALERKVPVQTCFFFALSLNYRQYLKRKKTYSAALIRNSIHSKMYIKRSAVAAFTPPLYCMQMTQLYYIWRNLHFLKLKHIHVNKANIWLLVCSYTLTGPNLYLLNVTCAHGHAQLSLLDELSRLVSCENKTTVSDILHKCFWFI